MSVLEDTVTTPTTDKKAPAPKPLKSGFCGNGFHEGTRPRSYNGMPQKVCIGIVHEAFRAIDARYCDCDCHTKLDEMFASVGMERTPQQNPEYVPYKRTFWMPSDDPGYTADIAPDIIAGKAVHRDREVGQTPSGRTQKGGLEFWVQRECLNYVETGEGDENGQCTVKFLSETIGKAEGLPPRSPGAIAAVFARWEAVGYALIGKKPARFAGLTPQGADKGLEWCKAAAAGK